MADGDEALEILNDINKYIKEMIDDIKQKRKSPQPIGDTDNSKLDKITKQLRDAKTKITEYINLIYRQTSLTDFKQ